MTLIDKIRSLPIYEQVKILLDFLVELGGLSQARRNLYYQYWDERMGQAWQATIVEINAIKERIIELTNSRAMALYDDSLMPYGQHKGEKMANVPAYYLIRMSGTILRTTLMY